MITDQAGKAHEVAITTAYNDYWTSAGELRADCTCGWWDHHPYLPEGQGFARLKLQFRAADHVPAKEEIMSETDTRPYPDGLSNDARLMRWVKDNVPDQNVRDGGTEPVTMTGGDLFSLLLEVTGWAYGNGTADVRESPARLTGFFAAVARTDRASEPGPAVQRDTTGEFL